MSLLISRREQLAAFGACVFAASARAIAAPAGAPFSAALLARRAEALSRRPWQAMTPQHRAHQLDYDALNSIHFRGDRALLGGDVRLFPLSRFSNLPVAINIVANGTATPVHYGPEMFESGNADLRALIESLDGFSGFRVMNPNRVGDWLAFQGASYFRSAGSLDQYGLSARGLAIDVSVPGRPEEFPRFTEFWLEHGPGGDLIVHALLDSASVTGAFRFVNRRGAREVTQHVTASLFARRDIVQLGIAPLTSMFWYGESDRSQAIDWRPEIHDSDGLLMLNGRGERIWRPLGNPPRITTSSFEDKGPRGFGLLQRDRATDHYQDDGVFYEKRPSLWVEPEGDWGAGKVVLYEIPTRREYEDNIVCFWSPAKSMRAGERRDFAYRLHWLSSDPVPSPLAPVVDLWTGLAGPAGHEGIPNARKVVVDFEGPGLNRYGSAAQLRTALSLSAGSIIASHAYPVHERPGRWRLTIDIARDSAETCDLRAVLEAGSSPVTETLIHQMHWTD